VWAGVFIETSLSGCNKRALYEMWGTTLRLTFAYFEVAACNYCKLITPSNITLAGDAATGILSRIDVTVVGTAGLPAGTVLAELQATPVTLFVPAPFTPAEASASKAASGNLPFTGSWNVSFTLVTGSKTEQCPLPVQSISCMPTFVRTPSGGCECPPGDENIDGVCTLITDKPACAVVTFTPNKTLTDNATLSLGFSDRRDPSKVTVLMRPKVAVRTAPASNPSALLELGRVVPGEYEIELAEGDTKCTLLSSVNVSCSADYVRGLSGTCIKDTTDCTDDQWKDPTTNRCRRKAEMAVRSSSETLQVTLVKTRSVTSVNATLEVRLKTGDIDAGAPITWTASPNSTDASWLSLSPSSGVIFSGEPVAPITVIVNGTGLNDTGTKGPIISGITITSTSSDPVFINGMNDAQNIPVQLFIAAVPYVGASDVTLTSSSGRIVPPGEPVEAGDRLTIAVTACDAQRLPISRQDLQLTVVVKSKLNGVHSVPLQLNSPGSNAVPNGYTATIPENWVKEPETVESEGLPSSVARPRDSAPSPRVPTASSDLIDRLACCDSRSSGLSSCRACPTTPRTSRSRGRSRSSSRTTSS
jgi:hypothetical protein